MIHAALASAVPPPGPITHPPTLLAEQQPPAAPMPLSGSERGRQVLFDLAPACNQTLEEFTATKYTFDYADTPMPLSAW